MVVNLLYALPHGITVEDTDFNAWEKVVNVVACRKYRDGRVFHHLFDGHELPLVFVQQILTAVFQEPCHLVASPPDLRLQGAKNWEAVA